MKNNGRSPTPLLGPQLRKLRQARGLSLGQVAQASGSSISAVHRYESGWDRFEIRTLRRLAAALGARLEIRLLATEDPARARSVTRRDLLLVVRPLFWDVDLTSAHLDAHSQWVLRRVLQFGNREQVTHARLYYGDEAVRNASRHRSMDLRTRRLWQVLLPEETDPR